MADREDFATAVGGLIKGRSPVGHSHTQIENGTAATRLNNAGGFQHLVNGELKTEFNHEGILTRGHVERLYGLGVGKQVRFDGLGRLQYVDNATGNIIFQISPNGAVTLGTVPWERITGAPPIPDAQPAVSIPGPLGPLFARLAHADTVTVPILFVGSSTTRRDYPKNVVSRIAAAYPSGVGEYGTVYAEQPLASHHTGPGVAGYNAGRGGQVASNYVDTPILDNAALVQPVAIFHGIGSNDWATDVPPATFEANVRAAIAAIDAQVTVPHVHVLMQQHTRAGTSTYPWGDYTAALRRIAEGTTDRLFVDLGPAIDRTDPLGADPFGYGSGDGTHMNALGEEALAELMVRALGVPGSSAAPTAAQPDSGLRNVTTLFGITSGSAYLQVKDGWVWLNFNNAVVTGSGAVVLTSSGLASIAPEAPIGSAEGSLVAGSSANPRRAEVNRYGRARVHAVVAGDVLNGSLSWPMTRPAPTTWPGAATT